jgi:hypothetical protein
MLIKTYDQYALLTFELDLVQDAPRLSFVTQGQPRPNSTEIDKRKWEMKCINYYRKKKKLKASLNRLSLEKKCVFPAYQG